MYQIKQFSIIIPHKNIPSLLKRCLESIPFVEGIEIIVIDDNSDPSIVDFSDFPGRNREDTQIHFTKEGKGAGYARNVGLTHATGKWLIFADADDFFNECFYETIHQYYESDADVVYYSATSVDSVTLLPSTRHLPLDNTIGAYDIGNPLSVERIRYSNWEPWSKMFSHEFIRSNQIRFDAVMVGNDLGFVLKAGHYSRKIEVSQSPIYCVTYRPNSLSFEDNERAFDNRFKAILLTNRYMSEFYPKRVHSIIPDILSGSKYGIFKVIKMVVLALKYRNNIFYGSRRYLTKQLNKATKLLKT